MTTILVLNAISSLAAAGGVGAFFVRRARRLARVQPAYVTGGARRRAR
jgi:anaerobic C4-dicarboxylate transporter